ncbi:MAG: two-component system, NarL family, response regulator LiaR [Solirubrobacteraceae bacterium]|jgi:DNA-binding NarL/FixJ family response regulator|nr:two-component system, NarL family, response regulator LiaR [Solirubrobacteraceae bacterium]
MSETGSRGESNAPGAALRVLVVDDHRLFRSGLRDVLEESGIAIAGEADSGEEALELAPAMSPDVVIMDLTLPGISGAEATRRLLAADPKLTVLVVTVSADGDDIDEALAAGARGYLLKDATARELVAGVRAAAAGEAPLSPPVAARLVASMRDARRARDAAGDPADLSERELQVLRLISEGRDNTQIARALYISPETVKDHVSHILSKLGVENRIQAAVYAVRTDLV